MAGGSDRVVDTAVAALVETGRVRVQSSGALCVVDARPGHETEAAVLDAIGPGGQRRIEMVRRRAGGDQRLTRLGERLRSDGLLAGNRLAGPSYRLLRRLMAGPMRGWVPLWRCAVPAAERCGACGPIRRRGGGAARRRPNGRSGVSRRGVPPGRRRQSGGGGRRAGARRCASRGTHATGRVARIGRCASSHFRAFLVESIPR